MEADMDFDDFDDFEDRDDHDDFDNDEDQFCDDDIDNDIDEISNGEGSGEPDTGRTGLEWYEIGLLGALAEELSDEKKRRREKDRNPLKRKP
jgi:hypothetical protein